MAVVAVTFSVAVADLAVSTSHDDVVVVVIDVVAAAVVDIGAVDVVDVVDVLAMISLQDGGNPELQKMYGKSCSN